MANEKAPDDLISTVSPDETIAVVIPLYGFWKDIENGQLNTEVLKYSLDRIKSFFNKVYFLFPAEQQRLDPMVKNYLIGKQMAGNAVAVVVEPHSTYAEYLNEGISFALEETDCKYVLVVSPWIAIKEGALDRMVNLLNRPDVATCSGTDLRLGGVDDSELDTFTYNPPNDLVGVDINFFGMSRPVAEIMRNADGETFNTEYKTTHFLARDIFEALKQRGCPSLQTQQITFYSFPVDWSEIEDPADFAEDKETFLHTWNFDPGIEETIK
jgi:hypothetical protein